MRRITFVLAALLFSFGVLVASTPVPDALREAPAPSLRVLSRRGSVLREVRADDGARARPLALADFPPQVRSAVLAAEDRHFYSHPGVDPFAIVRALGQSVVHRRIVSGASTITMQLARTVRPHRKTLWGKIREAALAIRIEAAFSKDAILEQYLNRVAYGPNLRGYAAASHAYFGSEPDGLSLAQAALVAGLPRGPSLYQVTKRPDLARRRRDRVLARMAEAGMIDADQRTRASAEPVIASLEAPALGAPHFVRALVSGALADTVRDHAKLDAIVTTIDPDIQRAAETVVRTTLAGLVEKHVTAASVVVLDNASGDVLAWVGSPDFYDEAALGQNDGVLALRQPGSSLKPFVYAEAMTTLGYTGSTVLPDVELHIPLPGGAEYVPHDYDARLRGPTRLREALGSSLNVPAVHTIHAVGTARVLDRLHAFGFASLGEDAEHYGPALALGDGEVTLLELANAYASLARGGVRRPVRVASEVVRGGAKTRIEAPDADVTVRAVDERVAAMVTDILADKTARVASFGDQNVLELEFDVAAKTGTSKGYRDNVAVGYTRDVTVAVWAGNFDGSPMSEVGGITGAGPIFHGVMLAAATFGGHIPARGALSPAADAERLGLVRTAVCSLSGEIPTRACPHRVFEWRPEGDADHAPTCSVHEHVRVDVRNGLRAGPACPPATTEERVFERWSGVYDGWARETARPTPPRESSPTCPTSDDPAPPPGTLHVAWPFDGARFAIDPDRAPEAQLLAVRVEPDDTSAEVLVDGASLGHARAWPLAPGPHTITARAGSVTSPPVRIDVH